MTAPDTLTMDEMDALYREGKAVLDDIDATEDEDAVFLATVRDCGYYALNTVTELWERYEVQP